MIGVGASRRNNFFKKAISSIDDNFVFDLKVKMFMKLLHMPSVCVSVIKNDSVVWSSSYGFSSLYVPKKACLESIYVSGSISKCVTSTAMMQIIENESYDIDLDDNVSRWLPFDLKNPKFPDREITFRMVLAQQSSLKEQWYNISYHLPLIEDKLKWIKERIEPGGEYYSEDCWADFPPGEDSGYSNINFILISYIIEYVTGMSFDDYCEKNIFDPLGMNDTSFHIEKLDKKKFARPYYRTSGGIHVPLPHYDAESVAAAAGLRTNVVDASRFLITHMNKGVCNDVRILKESTVEEMHREQYSEADKTFYGAKIRDGLGWRLINRSGVHWSGYQGASIGYTGSMLVHRCDNKGIVIFSNKQTPISKDKEAKKQFDRYQELINLFLEKAD
ncbi:MAG: serine hydrolase domain-containing protein [Candidatus Thermoplasmatota archaeon]